MTYYRFPERKLNKAVFALFFTAMLYLARDTLVTSSILGFYKGQFLMLGLFAAAGMVFLLANRRRIKDIFLDRRMIAVAVASLVMLAPMAVKQDWQIMYFSILFCLLFAVFVSYFLSYQDLAKYYVVIMTVVGAYSVIATYGLRLLPDSGRLSVPVFQNQIGVEFYNFIVSFVSLEYVKNRNFGIFREPGVYQFFLILALYLTHYAVSWKRQWRMWVVTALLSVAMLSTLATGGILELGLLALVVFIDKKLYRNKLLCVLIALAVALGAAGFTYCAREQNIIYWEIYDMLIGKFTYQEESLADRMGSIFVNLEALLASPLFGGSISHILHAIENNTSSTMILLAIFGIPGGLLHIAGWFALVWRREQKLWVNLSLLLLLFLSFNTQNLTADVFFWLFPTMALTERTLAFRKKEKFENKRSAPMTPEELKKVQQVELEIAKDVKRVCQEYGIRYFLYRGTFLGAVRHKGVIPWDDDMDFGMLRADYDRFRQIAPTALGESYCFQDWSTDEGYALPFGKVRKRGTAFVEAKCARQTENGIYIDIYPLDFAPYDERERKALAFKLLHLFRLKLMKCGYTPWMEEDKILWKKRIGYLAYQFAALFFSQKSLVRIYEGLVYEIQAGDTLYEQSALPIAYYFDRDWCQNLREYPYEDTSFPGPEDYDGFLSSLYGDYMTLPPEGKRENRHQIQELSFGNE